MRFAVVGAGATGGYLGALLAHAGEDVTLVARGAHLAAMQARGVRVREAVQEERGKRREERTGRGPTRPVSHLPSPVSHLPSLISHLEFVSHPKCTDDLSVVAGADVVFLTVKAHAVAAVAPALGAVLGPGTAVVTAQNGVPWWYFQRHGGSLEGTRLRSVDPDGIIEQSIPAERVIGCVVWPATRLVEPGVIEHVEGNRFSIGELDGERTERCQAIAAALTRAGLKCPVSRRIRADIWLKLLGNVAMNPMGALTRATLVEIATLPETRAVARAVMEEANSIARALDIELAITVEQRLAGAEKVGAHKPSMLQDVESGRPLEVEALVGAVVELGELTGQPMPHLRTLYACVKLLSRSQHR